MEEIVDAPGLVRVVLDSPKVNAMGSQLLAQLAVGLEGLGANHKVRGVILAAEGNCFSAGLDLKEVVELQGDELVEFVGCLDRVLLAAFAFPKPMATSVRGHAIAGGLVLALATDHCALGAGEYRVGLTELAVGVPFPRSALEVVRSALSSRAMRRLVLRPDTLAVEEAWALGVGDSFTDDPDAAALDWVRQAAQLPVEPFKIAKHQLREASLARWTEHAASDRMRFAQLLQSPSARDAMRAALP